LSTPVTTKNGGGLDSQRAFGTATPDYDSGSKSTKSKENSSASATIDISCESAPSNSVLPSSSAASDGRTVAGLSGETKTNE
jgi:hypothetical protein